jgi:hypothetical protein
MPSNYEPEPEAPASGPNSNAQPSDEVELEQQRHPHQPQQQEPKQLFFFSNPLHEEQMNSQLAADDEPTPEPELEVEQLDQNSQALTPTPITTSLTAWE